MSQSPSLINLSKAVKLNLAKVTKTKIVAQVGLLDDVSGSAKDMHRNGITQRLFDRLFAVAFEFDDNATLDAWAFDTSAYELEPIKESMFGSYVDRYIMKAGLSIWGGTNYSPGMQAVISHYYPPTIGEQAQAVVAKTSSFLGKLFGKKEEAPAKAVFAPKSVSVKLPDPAFCMMVTDGENFDKDATRRLLEANSDKQIFWMIIGISERGSSRFPFLEELSRDFPNVGFYNAGEIDQVSDDQLYSQMFTTKFINWYEAARKVA